VNTRPELANNLASLYVNKVTALRTQGKLAEAIELCTRVIALDGANVVAWQACAEWRL